MLVSVHLKATGLGNADIARLEVNYLNLLKLNLVPNGHNNISLHIQLDLLVPARSCSDKKLVIVWLSVTSSSMQSFVVIRILETVEF